MKLKVMIRDMGILINMINAGRIKRRRTTLNAMNKVSFGKQQIREIGSVLPSDTRYQSNFSYQFDLFQVQELLVTGQLLAACGAMGHFPHGQQ
jgi:hypothetical protein